MDSKVFIRGFGEGYNAAMAGRKKNVETMLLLERNRIKANILSRVSELNACSKRDNCNELARLIESYIPEWLEGENK